MVREPRPWSTPAVVGLVVAVAVVAVLGGVVLERRTGSPSADSVDVGFLQDMRSHHDQAVQMASVAAATAADPQVRDFAREVLIFQQYEIGYMEALLEEWDAFPADPDRTAMEWMGMRSTVAGMPGMASEDELERLADASGEEANELFLRLMSDHHRGGLHMAEHAAENAGDARVRDLADRMARTQRAEIGEYRHLADQLEIQL